MQRNSKVTHIQENNPSVETISECFQMLGLADADFKAIIINMFKVPKKPIFKELNESITMMNQWVEIFNKNTEIIKNN